MLKQELNDSQKEFNDTYITTNEISEFLQVPRATISIWKSQNKLPDPISVGLGIIDAERVSQTLWKRDKINSTLIELKDYLDKRRTKK